MRTKNNEQWEQGVHLKISSLNITETTHVSMKKKVDYKNIKVT